MNAEMISPLFDNTKKSFHTNCSAGLPDRVFSPSEKKVYSWGDFGDTKSLGKQTVWEK